MGEALARLTQMGFHARESNAALEATQDNVEAALEWLLGLAPEKQKASADQKHWSSLRGLTLGQIMAVPDRYEVLDVPNEARYFSSKLHDFGKVWDKSTLQSDISWAPGPNFQRHGPDEYVVLDAGAPRNIAGVVISGCGCCKAHASQVRLSV